MAPRTLRSGLIECIDQEIENHKAGRPAKIQIKCNSMVDEAVIDSLYRASQADVPVDGGSRYLRLRPGVKGLSENIRVRSVLGRFWSTHAYLRLKTVATRLSILALPI